MHFGYSKTPTPAGDWANIVTVDSAWLTTLDQQLFKALNGDEGGAWNPSAPIVVGGSGLNVTGLLNAANIGASTVRGALGVQGNVTWQSGATATVQSGATLTQAPGSTLNLNGSVTASGSFTFSGATWPVLSARTVSRPQELAVSFATSVVTPELHLYPSHSNIQSAAYVASGGIVTDVLATNADFFYVPIRDLADGNTFALLNVKRTYSATPTVFARFSVVRRDVDSNEAILATVLDSGSIAATVVALSTSATIQRDLYTYFLKVQCPANAGTILTITGVSVDETITTMRTQ